MRSCHFYYVFLILDSSYRVCYYNVVGRIKSKEVNKMVYKIYYHDKLVSTKSRLRDVFRFISTHGYVMYDDVSHLDENYINVYCI